MWNVIPIYLLDDQLFFQDKHDTPCPVICGPDGLNVCDTMLPVLARGMCILTLTVGQFRFEYHLVASPNTHALDLLFLTFVFLLTRFMTPENLKQKTGFETISQEQPYLP